MTSHKLYKIRPAGRHILTIGRDLIQDSHAAVVELVKNAFDADSPSVEITFKANSNLDGYCITIIDHGHGMSKDTVITKWLVPSTPDKLERKHSPSGRLMQGRKGVGRYAASILGNRLQLETTTSDGERTTALIEWNKFEDAEYLEDVSIPIETTKVLESQGTQLTITGDESYLKEWDKKQFDKLRFELKKLISPVSAEVGYSKNDDGFIINIEIKGFDDVEDIDEIVEPYPIFELFDYRIAGKIGSGGKGELMYHENKTKTPTTEKIPFDLEESTGCGELSLDVRVYDREGDAIASLIKRGLKDETGQYVKSTQARALLNESNGIGVYRNGFRIRPLGDADFDWLRLNEQRVQNPSLRVGSNQVIGYVQIQSEDKSKLVEKSARDGLRENVAYDRLKEITRKVIAELETRRFRYRRNAGTTKSIVKVEEQLEQLYLYDDLKGNIKTKLDEEGVGKKTADQVLAIIDEDAEKRNTLLNEISRAVAIYQGQATLGKIINIVLHEGRKPLSFFRNEIPNLKYWHESLKEGEKRRIFR